MRVLLVLAALLIALIIAAIDDGRVRIGRLLLSLDLRSFAIAAFDDPAWRGVALYEDGRWHEAIESFKAAAAGSAYNLGNALARGGRYAEAVAAYDEALARDPDDMDAHANRAIVMALLESEEVERAGRGARASARAVRDRERGAGFESDRDEAGQDSTGDGLAGRRASEGRALAAGGREVDRLPVSDEIAGDGQTGQARGSATDSAGAGESNGGIATAARAEGRYEYRDGRWMLERERYGQSVAPTVDWLATMQDDPGRFLKLRLAYEQMRREREGTAVVPAADGW